MSGGASLYESLLIAQSRVPTKYEMQTVSGYVWANFVIYPDCFNQQYLSSIAGQPVVASMPRLVIDAEGYKVEAPDLKGLHLDPLHTAVVMQSASSWARLVNGPEPPKPRFAHVNCIGITTEVHAKYVTTNKKLRNMVKASDQWWDIVTSWIEVLSGQDIKKIGPAQPLWRPTVALEMLPVTEKEYWSNFYQSSTPVVPGIINSNQLQVSFSLAGKGIPPPDEWLFIRDAQSLTRSAEYRRAIIDAGTAAEIGLTRLIDQKLSDRGLSIGAVNQILAKKKYRTLGGRAYLYEKKYQLGKLPTNFNKILLNPRNDATHDKANFRRIHAQRAIAKARKIVEKAAPLDIESIKSTGGL